MSCAVRLFTHSGVVAMPLANPNAQLATNGEYMLVEPQLASEAITADENNAVASTTALAPANTKLLKVEVQRGCVIHYEITRNNADLVTATTSSPTLSGRELIDFGPGYRISVLQAGSEA